MVQKKYGRRGALAEGDPDMVAEAPTTAGSPRPTPHQDRHNKDALRPPSGSPWVSLVHEWVGLCQSCCHHQRVGLRLPAVHGVYGGWQTEFTSRAAVVGGGGQRGDVIMSVMGTAQGLVKGCGSRGWPLGQWCPGGFLIRGIPANKCSPIPNAS